MIGFIIYGLTAPLYYAAKAISRAGRRRRYTKTCRPTKHTPHDHKHLAGVGALLNLTIGTATLAGAVAAGSTYIRGNHSPDTIAAVGVFLAISAVTLWLTARWALQPDEPSNPPEPPESPRPQAYYSNRR